MKTILKSTVMAITLAFLTTSAISAEYYTKGFVKKVNMKSRKVTIKHEELKNLGMPGMTMVFRTKDEEMLGKLKAGTKIQFLAERIKGKLTLVKVK